MCLWLKFERAFSTRSFPALKCSSSTQKWFVSSTKNACPQRDEHVLFMTQNQYYSWSHSYLWWSISILINFPLTCPPKPSRLLKSSEHRRGLFRLPEFVLVQRPRNLTNLLIRAALIFKPHEPLVNYPSVATRLI